MARLSDNKARRLRGLESHASVRAAFDSLLAVPALVVQGMQIGSLPQVLAMCCDKVIQISCLRAAVLILFAGDSSRADQATTILVLTHET